MVRPCRASSRPAILASLAVALALVGGLRAAEVPRLRELRTQRVGETIYFHARFSRPADMQTVPVEPGPLTPDQRRRLANLIARQELDEELGAEAFGLAATALFQQLPVTAGIQVQDPKAIAKKVADNQDETALFGGKPLKPAYKGGGR